MKVYRTIVIVIAILASISFFTFGLFAPCTQVAIHNPPTKEYYDQLKEEAMKVAKKLDRNALTDETLTADFYFNENELVVIVESMQAKLTAKIPMSAASYNIEDDTIIFKGICEFENVKYEGKNLIDPAWYYILLAIFGALFSGIMIYLLLLKVWHPKTNDDLEDSDDW